MGHGTAHCPTSPSSIQHLFPRTSFSGDLVDISHKRNLYRVIVGRDGVDLAKAIESLDDASRTKAAEIREKAALIQAVHLRGMTLETFLGLERDPEIDEKLRAKESELEAV